MVALLAMLLVEPAPPEPDEERSHRSICPLPAVKLTPEAPWPTTSTIQEPEVGTKILDEMDAAEAALLATAAVGADWVTPAKEIEPAVADEIGPVNDTRT